MNCAYVLFGVGGYLIISAVVKICFQLSSTSTDLSVQTKLGEKVGLVPLQRLFMRELHGILIGVGLVSVGVILGALVFRNLKRKGRANQLAQTRSLARPV